MTAGEGVKDPPSQPSGGAVLAVLRMGDANCVHHLEPMAQALGDRQLWVVRPLARPDGLRSVARYTEIRRPGTVRRLGCVLFAAVRLARNREVRAVVSFNGVPYGVIAWIAARLARKPVHVGLVGTEAHRLAHHWYGPLIDRVLRRVDLITVPGPAMRASLEERGYPGHGIHVLPHGIDLDQFGFGSAPRDIDVLFVGSFNATKQIDRIIVAIDDLRRSHPGVRFTLVGDGPLRADLEGLVQSRGLDEHVDFAGFQQRPGPFYARARTVVIASKWEGFPFVLVEAMAAGAIPVTTPVGSIPDYLIDGSDGIILASDDPGDIATGLRRILDDADLESSVRQSLETDRARLGYEHVADFWRTALASMNAQ